MLQTLQRHFCIDLKQSWITLEWIVPSLSCSLGWVRSQMSRSFGTKWSTVKIAGRSSTMTYPPNVAVLSILVLIPTLAPWVGYALNEAFRALHIGGSCSFAVRRILDSSNEIRSDDRRGLSNRAEILSLKIVSLEESSMDTSTVGIEFSSVVPKRKRWAAVRPW